MAGDVADRAFVFVAKVIFLLTGVWWGVGIQLMVYAGLAADPAALLPNFTWYSSMCLGLLLSERFFKIRCCEGAEPAGCEVAVGCLRPKSEVALPSDRPRCWWSRVPPCRGLWGRSDLVLASVCDYVGTVATAGGLTLAGSGIFGIIYSSVSCWAALFAYCMLGRRLVALQICGMTVVVAGLMISSLDNDLDSEDGKRVALGSILIAGGTMAYGLEYAVCERLMAGGHAERAAGGSGDDDSEKRAAANEAIVEMMWYMGLWGTLLSAIYTVAYVVPRWDEMVGDRIEASGASPGWLAFLVVSHTASNWLHNLTWFIVCDREGSVSTGLLQGLKAVMLFFGSSAAFCHRQESQCMTRHKAIATAVVTVGTALYYLAPTVSTAELAATRGDGAGAYELVAKDSGAEAPEANGNGREPVRAKPLPLPFSDDVENPLGPGSPASEGTAADASLLATARRARRDSVD